MQYAQKQSTAAAGWTRRFGKYPLFAFDDMGAGRAVMVRGVVRRFRTWADSASMAINTGIGAGAPGNANPRRYAGKSWSFGGVKARKKDLREAA